MSDTTDRYIWAQGWGGYPSPVFRVPGEPIKQAQYFPDFSKQYIVQNYGLMDQISVEDIRDDIYGVINKILARKGGLFARAFMDLLEIACATYFAVNGFTSGTSVAGMADGVSLFNTAHPQSAANTVTTYTNRPAVDADLSITTAQFMFVNLWLQTAPNGITKLNNRLKAVVYNPILDFVFHQIFRQKWQPYSGDRTEGFIDTKNVEGIPWAYFTKGGTTGGAFGAGASNAYFGLGQEHHLHFYMRQPVEFDTDMNINTRSQALAATIRFIMGADSARGVVGSSGA